MSYDPEPTPAPTDPAPRAATPPDATPDAIGRMSFERALEELEAIVQNLERGRLELDAAIEAYERGSALRRHCEDKLKKAELRVQQIASAPGGGVRLEDPSSGTGDAPF